jgi:hypothetical protein
MKSPIILEGEPFPWDEPNPFGKPTEDNPLMWAAAAWADPGVMSCPKCSVYLWNEGLRVCCPECAHEFDTSNKAFAERMRSKP